WRVRKAELDDITKGLKLAHRANGANGFDTMLKLALGTPNPGDPLPPDIDLVTLDNNLKNNIDVENTKAKIQSELYMKVEYFSRLMAIKTKNDDPSPQKVPPSAAEWNEVYAILASAQKAKRQFPQWSREEQ